MNPAEIQRTVGLEFDNLDTRYEELVLDYSVLESRVGGESKGRILCCAMGKPMLDSYRSLFAAAGIQPTVCDMGLNCLIKAAALFPDLRAKPCVLATIDSRVLSCVLFADGQYLYANRYPLLSAPKTPEYTAEVASRLSAINQFYKSEKGNVALEQVYFYGVTDSTLDLLQSAAPALGMQLRPLPDSPQLSMPEGETRFEPGDYLAAIGCLLRK